jgi:hypothetical protein
MDRPVLVPARDRAARRRAQGLRRPHLRLCRGKQDGLVIVNVTNPERPVVYRKETFGGRMNDVEDVVVASTNASLFAYVADGRNGLKVLQLTSPDSQPNFYGFSPAPVPELIAWAKTPHPRSPWPRASTATARSTRPAARSRSSAGSARARSPGPRWSDCSSTARLPVEGEGLGDDGRLGR